jgi:hypothetical protein
MDPLTFKIFIPLEYVGAATNVLKFLRNKVKVKGKVIPVL